MRALAACGRRRRAFAALLGGAALIAAPAAAADALRLVLAPLDVAKLAREDAEADRKNLTGGWRYAVPVAVELTPARDGAWRALDATRSLWQLAIEAPGARHLNFGFGRFRLPPGATLSIRDPDRKQGLGPYTAADNDAHGELWTPILFGERALIELVAPTAALAAVELTLTQIGHGYRGFGPRDPACKSGACNMDVACLGAADPWNENRRAVGAMSSGGSRFCTGSLVNNTRGDRRMLFITATHCGVTAGNAASLVVFWNFDAPSCRTPGSAASGSPSVVGPLNQNQSGALFLAATNDPFRSSSPSGTASDVTLLELDDPANPAFNLHWAGWDRRAAPAPCSEARRCASIHHPDGDEKRITFSREPLVVGNIAFAMGLHWRVQWDSLPPILPNIQPPQQPPPGVTEPGSSGSPLYNADRRLVGVLSGGASFCGVAVSGLNDEYGQIAHAWLGLGTPTTRLREHLDPLGTGIEVLDGLGASGTLNLILASSFEDP